MFHFIFSYKVIILLAWFLYEIKSHCMKGKNKYKFEIGTSSLTDVKDGSCAFGISHQALARSPRPEWFCTFYLLKYSGNRLTSFVHYLLLFHLPSRGIACKLMNILKVAYFQCNETIDACHSTFAMLFHKEKLQRGNDCMRNQAAHRFLLVW